MDRSNTAVGNPQIQRLGYFWQQWDTSFGLLSRDSSQAEEEFAARSSKLRTPATLPPPSEWPPPSGWSLPSEWALPLFAFGGEGWAD
jgi:hypothetical protein